MPFDFLFLAKKNKLPLPMFVFSVYDHDSILE